MKIDKMKDFIQNNKASLEEGSPSANLWDKIEENLPPEINEKEVKMMPVKQVWRLAMSSAAVIAIALFAFQYSNSAGPTAAQNEGEFKNVNQLENYYSLQVNDRIEKLKSYEVDDELLEEIAFLKEEFEVLKSEVDKGLNQEDILDSMIDNYRLRVSILEEIMREVQKKEEKNEKNTKQ